GSVRLRLQGPLCAVPRADVERHRARAEQHGHEEDGENRGLAAGVLRVHSTRSVVLLWRSPEATTTPNRLIVYGYAACTVTGSPGCHVEVTETFEGSSLMSPAEVITACCATPVGPAGSVVWRETAALRAPAR